MLWGDVNLKKQPMESSKLDCNERRTTKTRTGPNCRDVIISVAMEAGDRVFVWDSNCCFKRDPSE